MLAFDAMHASSREIIIWRLALDHVLTYIYIYIYVCLYPIYTLWNLESLIVPLCTGSQAPDLGFWALLVQDLYRLSVRHTCEVVASYCISFLLES